MRLKGPFRKLAGMSKQDHGHHVGPDGLEFDVPFVHQNHINLCGDASAQMLLLFNQRTPNPGVLKQNAGHANSFRLRRNPRGIFSGSTDDTIVTQLRGAGLIAWNICPRVGPWSADRVLAALETYGPYAQFFHGVGHWVVVKGVDGNSVFYQDPWRGKNKCKPIDDWINIAGHEIDSAVAATEDYPAPPPHIQADLR